MSGEPLPAMRKTDYLKKDASQALGVIFGLLKQFVSFSKWGVRIASLVAAPETGGFSIAVGFVASAVLDKAFEKASEWAIDEVSRKFAKGPIKDIHEGSPNVFFNKLEAARGGSDGDDTELQQIMQGSEWVYTNQRPAARQDDRTRSSGFCVLSPDLPDPNIFIGGPPTEFDNKPYLGPEAQLLLKLADNAKMLKELPKKISNLSMQAKQLEHAYDMGGKVGRRSVKFGKDAYELGNGLWGMVK